MIGSVPVTSCNDDDDDVRWAFFSCDQVCVCGSPWLLVSTEQNRLENLGLVTPGGTIRDSLRHNPSPILQPTFCKSVDCHRIPQKVKVYLHPVKMYKKCTDFNTTSLK